VTIAFSLGFNFVSKKMFDFDRDGVLSYKEKRVKNVFVTLVAIIVLFVLFTADEYIYDSSVSAIKYLHPLLKLEDMKSFYKNVEGKRT